MTLASAARREKVMARPRPYRKGSVFGAGRRRPLDREQRARWRFLARAHARAGRLPAKQEWVALALLKRLGEDGRCDPCHDTLAADAGCSARTVRRATDAMQRLGLLRWQTRLVRGGWQAHQTSNAYELLPEAATPAVCHDGQSGRATTRIGSKAAAEAPSGGSDEWGRWNAARQIALLMA